MLHSTLAIFKELFLNLKMYGRQVFLSRTVYLCARELSPLIPHGKTKMLPWLAISPRSTAESLPTTSSVLVTTWTKGLCTHDSLVTLPQRSSQQGA